MSLFSRLDDAHAVTYKNGLFKQAELYTRNNRVYVKEGSGYAYLRDNGATSVPKLRYDELIMSQRIGYDDLGRMVLANS